MKKTLAVLMLTFALAMVAHSQVLKWEHSISISPTWGVTNSGMFPDGVGGGAILFSLVTPTGNVTRVVWLSAAGRLNASHDIQTGGPGPLRSNIGVLRVTANVFDIQTTTSAPGVALLRFVRGKSEPTERLLEPRGEIDFELPVTLALPVADKRGFFTTQYSGTNVVIRRYRF